jgi:hypothetical protein
MGRFHHARLEEHTQVSEWRTRTLDPSAAIAESCAQDPPAQCTSIHPQMTELQLLCAFVGILNGAWQRPHVRRQSVLGKQDVAVLFHEG